MQSQGMKLGQIVAPSSLPGSLLRTWGLEFEVAKQGVCCYMNGKATWRAESI